MADSCKLINIILTPLVWQGVINWEANALGQVDFGGTPTLQSTPFAVNLLLNRTLNQNICKNSKCWGFHF